MRFLRGLQHNRVTTGETPHWPEIQPLPVDAAPARVFAEIVATAKEMPGCRKIEHDDQTYRLTAESVTRIFRWVDDVEIWITPDNGGSTVMMHSASRVGKGDLGANAKRIQSFLRRLRQRLHA